MQYTLAIIVALMTIFPSIADEEEAPSTASLETMLLTSIQNEDPVAFAHCWISAIDLHALMIEQVAIEPRLAGEVEDLNEVIKQFKERNKRISLLSNAIQNAIKEYELDVRNLAIHFGDARKQELGQLVRYEVSQIFEIRSEAGWVLKIEIDDIYSYGGDYKFYDSPKRAVLTVVNGEKVEVYNSGSWGIGWGD